MLVVWEDTARNPLRLARLSDLILPVEQRFRGGDLPDHMFHVFLDGETGSALELVGWTS